MKLLEALEQLNIDTKTLLERFSGNTALLERFILKFPQDKTFESLCTAVEVLDYDNMERTAHTLKGIAANLSFDNLYQACTQMVSHLRQTELQAALADFQTIKKEYNTVIQTIAIIN